MSRKPVYLTIAEALASARGGAEIRVGPGVYRERVVLKKGVTLRGEGPERTIIEGPVIAATAARVVGVTIRGANPAVIIDGVSTFTLRGCWVREIREGETKTGGVVGILVRRSRVRLLQNVVFDLGTRVPRPGRRGSESDRQTASCTPGMLGDAGSKSLRDRCLVLRKFTTYVGDRPTSK